MPNPATTIRFPVFHGFTVHVILAKDVARTAKRLKSDLSGAAAGYITKENHPFVGWIVLGPDIDTGIIAHESAHAVFDLFKQTGAGIDEEAFAYHLGYLVERIYNFVQKHGS
jgi:hypothetical protein